MGFYQSAYWLSDTWGANRQERRSGTYHSYMPDTLCDLDISLAAEASAAAAQAQADLVLLNARATHLFNTEPLARLILRAEAVASSKIEGLEMSVGRLLEYEALDELGVRHRVDGTEAAVLSNIAAVYQSIEDAAGKEPFCVSTVCDINARLLVGTNMESFGGIVRKQQNWIGGNNVNPLGAAYVPPKPEQVPALMEDLAQFLNTSRLPPVAVAAIAHAQLETIHPFADGNGRTGRALVHAVLRRAQLAVSVIPPVSLILATDKDRYLANLVAYRTDDSDASQNASEVISDWVEYFARMVSLACERAQSFEDTLIDIQRAWRERLRPRANSAADILLSCLVDNPVVSIESASQLVGRSYEAARNAVSSLTSAGILTQNARNKKSNLYLAQDVIDAFTRYERALATVEGDTSQERPARPVPQRVRARSGAEVPASPGGQTPKSR